jgi:hypothetical protein
MHDFRAEFLEAEFKCVSMTQKWIKLQLININNIYIT